MATGQAPVLRREECADRGQNLRRLGETPRPEFAARHWPLVRTDDGNASARQRAQICLGGRMLPHPHIHRGRRQHGLVGRQQQRGGEVVRNPRCHARQDVRGCRCNHHQVGGARQLNMPHLAFVGQREQVGIDLVLTQRLQRQWRDKLAGRFGQNAGHAASIGPQKPDQLQRFVSCDPARNDEQDALAAQVTHNRQPEWIAAIPPDRLRNVTFLSPACSIIATNRSWFGNVRMLSARYW